tara:strand:+ start:1031 stop:1381 length:351 start_codon:yes stop_codon:yes gene_type:complete
MNKLLTLKCFEVTSQTQANNGTVCYYDPVADADYLSYENGYIRRAYIREYPSRFEGTWKHRTIYQLNPQRKGTYQSKFNDTIYDTTERVMVPDPQKRLDLLAKAVVNYRKTVKSYK